MPRAVIILADLFPIQAEDADPAAVPRLPVLEHWLARSQCARIAGDDWRVWLHRRLGADLRHSSDASGYWFATPVHAMAGLDTVRLHGDGLLRLPLDEQHRLVAAFERTFAGSGWQLIPTDARELLLRGPDIDADAPDPARFLGRSTRDAQLQGRQVVPLRRLQGEIDMWLHAADFLGRAGHQVLKANGLWLWGRQYAGPLVVHSQSYAQRRPGVVGAELYADDLAARTCAAAGGLAQSGLPEAWPEVSRADLDRFVVLTVQNAAVPAQLADIEQRWLRPALASRQSGRYRAIELVCGSRHWVFDRMSALRVWRRRQHWLQELLAW